MGKKTRREPVVEKNFAYLLPGGGLPYETDGDARRKF